jgi:hypothetical protein
VLDNEVDDDNISKVAMEKPDAFDCQSQPVVDEAHLELPNANTGDPYTPMGHAQYNLSDDPHSASTY